MRGDAAEHHGAAEIRVLAGAGECRCYLVQRPVQVGGEVGWRERGAGVGERGEQRVRRRGVFAT
ncbi:MAG TPA: hypothetical protein VMV92_21780 [Streptosporangiaceae bacterium]|nr:hypothetical protein [Streptosporangiaceae bacterium]